jgi:hypothetical protein
MVSRCATPPPPARAPGSRSSARRPPRRRYLQLAAACACLVLVTPGHGSAPPARYLVDTSATVPSVTDTLTQLAWQRSAPLGPFTWCEAHAYCAGLGPGWRVPTVSELQSLVDETSLDANGSNFLGGGVYYWTSSPSALEPGFAWWVAFGYGQTNTDNAANSQYCNMAASGCAYSPYAVRCVR